VVLTRPRTAADLDAVEFDDFQLAARLLVAHGLLTASYPDTRALGLVRRFEEPLRAEFSRMFAWQLVVDPTCARLVKPPVATSAHRPMTAHDSRTRRAFRRNEYVMLCLTLAGFERTGRQTTIKRLVEEVQSLCPASIAVDFTELAWRRCFVVVVSWLIDRGVVVESADSRTEAYIDDPDADALYTVDADALRRVVPRLPADGELTPQRVLDSIDQPVVPMARQRLHRRIVEQVAVYTAELPADEQAVLSDRRGEITAQIHRLFGVEVEARTEGIALVDTETLAGALRARDLPGSGNDTNLAFALLGRLVSVAESAPDETTMAGKGVAAADVDRSWYSVWYAAVDGLTDAQRSQPDELRRTAFSLLTAAGLVAATENGLLVRPVAARYRVKLTGRSARTTTAAPALTLFERTDP
jgi:uncharacterized protein (TIGR02678 family)